MALPKFSNYISKRTGNRQSVLVTISIEGLGTVMENMEKVRADGPKVMGRALYAEAILIMREAKRLVPVRFGILRASGHVIPPDVENGLFGVELGFGGPAGIGDQGETNIQDVGYALPVHENLSAHHKTGQAKFLETPALAAADGLEDRVGVRIKRDLNL